MNLREIARNCKDIVIQCHNAPDADTIGAGYALKRCFETLGKQARLVYAGNQRISKPNLLMFIDAVGIGIEYVKGLSRSPDLLITVDCQYGSSNVDKLPCKKSMSIDHHKPEIPEDENTLIRPELSSCSTVVWDLLLDNGFAAEKDEKLCTALYFGLLCDSNDLTEMRHPMDRDLADAPHDAGLIKKLRNSAFTIEELNIMSRALQGVNMLGKVGLFKSEACDPNLLGFASDIAMKVERVDCCIMYCPMDLGLKLSVRSSSREIMANEIAAFICAGVGGGGGGIEKAGGMLIAKAVAAISRRDCEAFLKQRVIEYITYYEHVYAGDNRVDFKAMKRYRKLAKPVGFARSAHVFPKSTKITIRTLEGDIDTAVNDNVYLMIGIEGEAYPILSNKFEKGYTEMDLPYEAFTTYNPVIINRETGEKRQIADFARVCVPKGTKVVRAAKLTKPTKVFSNWDKERYFVGMPGDFIVADDGDLSDCHIIQRDIFYSSYEEMDGAAG